MTLHLNLKKQWFDMIANGVKKEEYREIKPYWNKRLGKEYKFVQFRNGYSKTAPTIILKCKGIKVDLGVTAWGAPSEPVYCILLGDIVGAKCNINLEMAIMGSEMQIVGSEKPEELPDTDFAVWVESVGGVMRVSRLLGLNKTTIWRQMEKENPDEIYQAFMKLSYKNMVLGQQNQALSLLIDNIGNDIYRKMTPQWTKNIQKEKQEILEVKK